MCTHGLGGWDVTAMWCVLPFPQPKVDVSKETTAEAAGTPLRVGGAVTPIVGWGGAATEMKVTAV